MKRQNKTLELINKTSSFFNKKSRSNEAYEKFQSNINYYFHNQALLIQSLTHKSHIDPDNKKRLFSNERLEFLGDSVLNFLVTEYIYNRYPDYSEGELSKMKSILVSRKVVGEVGASLDIGSFLIVGESEKKSSGRYRLSIISNAFEAVLGAIYLDSNINEVRKVLVNFLLNRINEFITNENNVNYKSLILEMSQGDGFGIPTYPLLAENGPEHDKKFVVGIEVAGIRLGEGTGFNKKIAQQNAAYKATRNYNKKMILSHHKGV